MVGDIMRQAISSLRFHRRRSVLTILGMAWGIATVVLLLAYGSGFQQGVMVAFRSFSGNLIVVSPGRTSLQAGGNKAGTEVRLTMRDMDYINAEVPFLQRVSPQADKTCSAAYENRSATANVSGVYASYARMRRLEVGDGEFFSEQEDSSHSRVAVLGSDIKKKVFSGENAVGNTVRIDGLSYVVVGVLKHAIQDSDENVNNKIFVPFSAMSDLRNTFYLDSIMLVYEGSEHAKVAKALRASMAFHHNFDPKDKRAVYIFDGVEDLQDVRIITSGIRVLLGFIGLLTLSIGGIGLMNIMLVSVQQRTREIGVEKALGARKRHILFQFLLEALAITFLGGIAGVAMAYLISWTVGSLPLWSAFYEDASEGDIHLAIQGSTLLVSTVILTFVGIISGMLPAIRAAHLDPIESLRYE